MNTDDRTLLKSIARRMIAEAASEACHSSGRELPGGLIVRYHHAGGLRQLVMTSQHPGPTPAEREDLRTAFDVPGTAFEIKAPQANYIVISLEWEEVKEAA